MDYTTSYTIADNECTATPYIQIESTLIDDYVAGLPTPDHTLKLTIKQDCETTYTVDLDGDNIVAGDPNYYRITPEDLGTTTTIDDGIYDITLTKTVTSNSNTSYEYSCVFVNCKVKCELEDYITNNFDYVLSGASGLHFIYDVLSNTDSCGQCNCSKVCEAYTRFKEILDTSNPTSDDCGCS